MADKVRFELVSPERILLSEEVDMVVVPGTEGNFGVLAGHAPFISSVRPGVIAVYNTWPGEVAERIFIAGGFAEVANNRCTVLADDAITLGSLDRALVEVELQAARDRLPGMRDAAGRGDESDKSALRRVEHEIEVAVAKLDALTLVAH
jgi:F-type H+-transporting ATPase subunit epsilon